VVKNDLEKVQMSSAKLFSHSILKCGAGCKMWKFDFVDAYKNVPVPIDDLRLQGFKWLGAFFVELKQMFGAAASVQNFDILSNTIKTCCMRSCNIQSMFVHWTVGQLDDVPVVSPENSNSGLEFESAYRTMCKKINMLIAPDCQKFEKAFSNSTYGKVLGIVFNTKILSWKLPTEKIRKCLENIIEVENKNKVSLLDMQTLLGNLNHIGQMCPFLLNFRFNLNRSLANCSVTEERNAARNKGLEKLPVKRPGVVSDCSSNSPSTPMHKNVFFGCSSRFWKKRNLDRKHWMWGGGTG
jgi:hypothetical protein